MITLAAASGHATKTSPTGRRLGCGSVVRRIRNGPSEQRNQGAHAVRPIAERFRAVMTNRREARCVRPYDGVWSGRNSRGDARRSKRSHNKEKNKRRSGTTTRTHVQIVNLRGLHECRILVATSKCSQHKMTEALCRLSVSQVACHMNVIWFVAERE